MTTHNQTRRTILRIAGASGLGAVLAGCGGGGSQVAPLRVDDGTADVPAAVPGSVGKVVVVGAGISGLAAAKALMLAGIDVTVIEAKRRIGGRTHTISIGGGAVDMGGAWVHAGELSVLAPVLRAAGSRLLPAKITDAYRNARVLDTTAAAFADASLTTQFKQAMLRFDQQVEALATSPEGQLMTLEQGIDAMMPDVPLAIRRPLGRFMASFAGSSPPDIGLAAFAEFYLGTALPEQDVFPEGGYGKLVGLLADGLDVRTGTPVLGIRDRGTAVEVLTDSGALAASHVIVTVPLGVLKASAVAFEPALPANKLLAIQTIGFGVFEKVALAYNEVFWSPSASGGFAIADPSEDQWVSMLDMAQVQGKPVLVGITTGRHALSMLELPPAERAAQLAAIVKQTFGPGTPDPVAYAVTDWHGDIYTRGCYSNFPLAADGDAFAAAITAMEQPHGRILFAGEATSANNLALVDGAFQSGIREAKRLLRTANVAIT